MHKHAHIIQMSYNGCNPYHRLANTFCQQPQHDDELAKIAG